MGVRLHKFKFINIGENIDSKVIREYHSFAFSHHIFLKMINYMSSKFGRDRGHLWSFSILPHFTRTFLKTFTTLLSGIKRMAFYQ